MSEFNVKPYGRNPNPKPSCCGYVLSRDPPDLDRVLLDEPLAKAAADFCFTLNPLITGCVGRLEFQPSGPRHVKPETPRGVYTVVAWRCRWP